MEEIKNNEIALVAQNAGLAPTGVENLLKRFAAYFNEAKKLSEGAREIIVTDESQTDLMLKARETRLSLKSLRSHVEQVRVELKEQSLREGRAIDGVSNLIKALIVPVEEHLEKQEKYAEAKELERIEAKLKDRTEKLTPYVDDISLYAIKDMSDVAFENLLTGCKASFQAKKDAEAKAEADRIAEEKKKEEEAKKIREENEKLKREAELKEKESARINSEQEEKLKKEREAREEAEAKLKAEKEAQEKKEADAKAAEDAKKAADEEAKRKALLATDKEKLIELAGTIDKITLPAVSSKEAGDVVNEVQVKLSALSNYLREKSKTL